MAEMNDLDIVIEALSLGQGQIPCWIAGDLEVPETSAATITQKPESKLGSLEFTVGVDHTMRLFLTGHGRFPETVQ
ncbi:hypothetical protein JW868_02315, partial [Candidatus Woesearchaeota archaeon]|nr:hypothetical protein [Candidatus Woesearchaeota archaeon]